MKQTIKFFTLLLLTTTLFFSCGGDDGPDEGGTETSITISTNRTNAIIETGETFTFTVGNNLSENVNSSSTIYVDGTAISGINFTPPTTIGTYSVYAKKGDLQSNTITINTISGLESIAISTDKLLAKPGETATYTVTDNFGRNLTSSADISFSASGITLTSNEFTSNDLGHFDVQASFVNIDGNTFTSSIGIDYISLASSFKKKVLVEDYTGAWCGWCPRIAYGIELVEADTDFSIPVAVHNGDSMSYQYEATLRSYFGITSFPTGKLNRTIDWTYPENENIAQVTGLIENSFDTGLAISSLRNGNNLTFDVAIGFNNTRTEDIGLVVYFLEDGLHGTQTNYTSFYGGGATIENFEYNDVLRAAYTTLLGDAISSSDTESGDLTFKRFNVEVPSSSQASADSKLKIVAFILNKTTKTVLNAQVATIGTAQLFD